MNWEAVGAICAALGTAQGLSLIIVRAIVRDEIAKINGTYVRRGECGLIREEVERRLSNLEAG